MEPAGPPHNPGPRRVLIAACDIVAVLSTILFLGILLTAALSGELVRGIFSAVNLIVCGIYLRWMVTRPTDNQTARGETDP